MSVPSTSVRRRVAVGATFMVLLRFAFRAIGLVSTLILVRLLLPTDFGLVGLATVAYSAFDGLSQLSFDLAIIRMTEPQRVHYDTAWTLGMMRGVIIAVLVVATSPLLADFVGEPRVISLSPILAAFAIIQGFENIALVDFHRNLQYDRIFRYQVASKIVGALVVIPTAYLLRNYWALLCGIGALRLTRFGLGYAIRPYLPRFTLAGWQELYNFSKWLMITNVLTVIDQYCMTLTVGRIAGTRAIGIYQVANQIGSLPASEVAAPIRDPIYAGYSRIADNTELLQKHFLSNLSFLVALIAPLSFGICIMADPIAAVFLGQKWMAVVPLIRLIALYALFDAIGHSAWSLYMAMHRQRRFVGLFSIVVAVRLPAIVVGAYLEGINGAAVALVLTAAFNMVVWNGCVPAELGVKVWDFWQAVWRTIFASAAMLSCVAALLDYWPAPLDVMHAAIRFVAICLAGGMVHLFVQFAAWRLSGSPSTAEAEVMHLAKVAQQRVVQIMRGEAESSA